MGDYGLILKNFADFGFEDLEYGYDEVGKALNDYKSKGTKRVIFVNKK